MRKEGQITVFLSMILVCVFGLLCGILETARTAGARCYLQAAVNSSVQSVFSQYHRKLWEQYRILGLPCKEESVLNQEMIKFLEPYGRSSGFYPMRVDRVQILESVYLADEDGGRFEKEILDYMRYGIWNFELKPAEAAELFDNMKGALTVQEVSDSWRRHMSEAVKLERTLESILNCIGKQEEYAERAGKSLEQCDGPEFRRNARHLISELKRIPNLLDSYRRQAGKLAQALLESRMQMEASLSNLSESARAACEQELSDYETYVNEDGMRRREVEALQVQGEAAAALTELAIEKALEAEDYIDSWEPDDEDEELDEDAVWEPTRSCFSGLRLPGLSCRVGVKDTESKGILDRVEAMLSLDLLSLVLPEGAGVSDGILPLYDCPSRFNMQGGKGDSSLPDRLIVDEYSSRVFTDYLSEERRDVQYELEYIIAGKESDRDNLNAVVKQLILVREGANLLYLLTDSEKRGEAQALAAAIVGAVGLAPLVPVVTFFILSIWALGEALADIRSLLSGENVPLFKTRESWNLSLEGLLDMGREGIVDSKQNGEDGFSYSGYLKLLLFIMEPAEKRFRMMDVMQINIGREQPGFRISDCLVSVDLRTEVCGKHVFLSLPLLKTLGFPGDMYYQIKVRTQKSY